jgi:hypothetical protein
MTKKQQSGLPPDVSLSDLVILLGGLSKQRITQLEQAGIVERTGRDRYAISSVGRYCKFQREGGAASKPLQDVRLEVLQEKALMARLERERWLGEWLSRRLVLAMCQNILVACRNKLLGIGPSCAPRLAVEQSPAGCQRIVDARVREVLEDLSRLKEVPDRLAKGDGRPHLMHTTKEVDDDMELTDDELEIG